MAWAYEGNEGYVRASGASDHRPIYRLWKEPHHVYTTDRPEYEELARHGHAREGVAGYVARGRRKGHVALHWLGHPWVGDTLFTTNLAEVRKKTSRRGGYVDKGVVGFVAKERLPRYRPFYRAYDPVRRDHLFSHDVRKIDASGPTLEREELRELLREELHPCLWPYAYRIELADEAYYCPSPTVARDLIEESHVARHRYIEETFDCDDFAHLLKSAFIEDVYDSGSRSMPYAAGILWGNDPPHAMNFVVLSDGTAPRVRIVEPQRKATFLKPLKKVLSDIFLIVA